MSRRLVFQIDLVVLQIDEVVQVDEVVLQVVQNGLLIHFQHILNNEMMYFQK